MKDSEKGRYSSPDGSATWEYISVMCCASIMMCNGCIAGWNVPTLTILMAPDSPIPLSSSDASTLAALSSVGHTVASTLTMIMADRLGRRNSLLASSIPLIVSWLMTVMTGNIVVLVMARFIAGIAFGLNISIPPMYLGEIASAKFRGAIGMVCGVTFSVGMLFMFTIAPYMSIKMTASVCLGIATVTAISVWFIPESPYFLAMVGKIEEAEDVLEKLRGRKNVADELEVIKMTVKRKGENNGDDKGQREHSAFRQLIAVSGNRKAFGINILFVVVLQLGSFVPVMTYANIIIGKMNTGAQPHLCTIILGVIQLICNILIVFVIEKSGRRPLIFVSGLVSGFCVLVIGVYFYLLEYTKVDVTPYGMFALFAIFLNFIALNIGLMPLQIVILSEILGTEIKALASCLNGIIAGMLSALSAKLYLTVAETWDYGHCAPFFSFAAITWFGTALILKLLPETRGKTLFEIQLDLNR